MYPSLTIQLGLPTAYFHIKQSIEELFSRESPESGMPYLIDLSAPVLTTKHKIKIHFDPDNTCYSAFYVLVRNALSNYSSPALYTDYFNFIVFYLFITRMIKKFKN